MASARPAKPPPPISTSVRSPGPLRGRSVFAIAEVYHCDQSVGGHVLRRPGPAHHPRPRTARGEPVSRHAARRSAWQRVFGGQVIGQALVAATRTVEGVLPHSLHAYFLLAGDPKVPIVYDVDRIRDGKSFTTRRVVAIQHGQRDLLDVGVVPQRRAGPRPPDENAGRAASGRAAERGRDQAEDPAAAARSRCAAITSASGRSNCGRSISTATPASRSRTTASTSGCAPPAPLPDDPAIHRCALAYASDMTLLDTALLPHGRSVFDRNIMGASLDHALWFHRPFRADQWLLYTPGQPEPARRPRLRPRPDLRRRRHAGRLGRPGGPAAGAPGRAQDRPDLPAAACFCLRVRQ